MGSLIGWAQYMEEKNALPCVCCGDTMLKDGWTSIHSISSIPSSALLIPQMTPYHMMLRALS